MFKIYSRFSANFFLFNPPSFAKILVIVNLCTFKFKLCINLFAVIFLPLAILINLDRAIREALKGKPEGFFYHILKNLLCI